jgi:hypothetical protein
LRVIVELGLSDGEEAILGDGIEEVDKGFCAVDSSRVGVGIHIGESVYKAVGGFELEDHADVAKLVPEIQVVFPLEVEV